MKWKLPIALLVLLLPTSLTALDIETRINKRTLANGIKIFVYERHTAPIVSFYIGHKVGAVDDKDGRTGAAHFLEHLLFKGAEHIGSLNFAKEKEILEKIAAVGNALDKEKTMGTAADGTRLAALEFELQSYRDEHRQYYIAGELARLYAENGAEGLNASTGKDLTLYMVSLPRDKVELWARLEAERRRHPVFREFYAERDVVAQERRQRTDGLPEGRLDELFFAVAFIAHPYRTPTIGWMDDINALDYEYMRQYFQNFYTPGNTFIAVVGDVKTEEIISLIDKYFGKLQQHEQMRHHIGTEPPAAGERRAQLVIDANERIIIGFHKPTLPHKDDIVFETIEAILAIGRSSRLHRKLVEGKNPIAQSVSAVNGYPGIRYDNLFCIYATPLQGHGTQELEEAIYAELERLKTDNISEAELRKVKNQKRFNLLTTLASNSGLASLIAYYATITGDTAYINTYLQELERVTEADIKRVAREYFQENNRTTAVIKKK